MRTALGRRGRLAAGAWVAVAAAVAGIAGCVAGDRLKAKAHVVGDLVAKARAQHAELCAPKEFAYAEAHLEFAEGELRTGDWSRANDHLLIADKNARIAVRDSVGCVEGKIAFLAPKEGDRDGDGFMDHKDGCPDDPEDFDGFEDEDGCPDKDNDKDGILDVTDKCPMDPEDKDSFQDDDGCPDLDNDKDGIADVSDKCPMDPEDKDSFEDEDGCPDLDNDKDGLADAVDSCPMEPEDKDGFEDEDGCPDPDNDKDKIADLVDKCPMDPEDYDGDEDTDGCPDLYKLVVVTKDRIEIKEKIFFAFNKATILKKSFALLDDVSRVLVDNPGMKIRIEGHTDSRGKDAYNKKLSDARAKSVRAYLVKKGIAEDRMTAIGYGEEVPIDTNLTDEGRANNRRVEFHITDR
ncbi:MAG TPA: OmpA family protein [Myxococcota bacterium]|nr:OmpA family protein [Myxococcota bacterium]